MSAPLHKSTPWALGLFAAGVLLLVLVTAFEHTPALRWLFDQAAGGLAYLALEMALFLATLAFSGASFLRGTTRDRLLVAIPAVVVIFYLALLAAGPG